MLSAVLELWPIWYGVNKQKWNTQINPAYHCSFSYFDFFKEDISLNVGFLGKHRETHSTSLLIKLLCKMQQKTWLKFRSFSIFHTGNKNFPTTLWFL